MVHKFTHKHNGETSPVWGPVPLFHLLWVFALCGLLLQLLLLLLLMLLLLTADAISAYCLLAACGLLPPGSF